MKKLIIFVFLVFAPLVVRAQTACPVGVAAGSAQCGPSPTDSSPAAPETIRYVPTGEWKKTWGAVAIDSETGAMGATFDQLSRGDAEREALSNCGAKGSTGCKIEIAYRNQCVATFFPSVAGQRGLSASGATVEEATRRGSEKCRSLNGSECNRVYTRCTEPLFEKY